MGPRGQILLPIHTVQVMAGSPMRSLFNKSGFGFEIKSNLICNYCIGDSLSTIVKQSLPFKNECIRVTVSKNVLPKGKISKIRLQVPNWTLERRGSGSKQ